jgi:hypothetical protein
VIRNHWLTTRNQLCSESMAVWGTVTNLLCEGIADSMTYDWNEDVRRLYSFLSNCNTIHSFASPPTRPFIVLI